LTGAIALKLHLSHLAWQVRGFRPYYWFKRNGIEHVGHFQPDIQAVAAVIPGSAQTALRKARKLPDWNVGTDSLLCQWVEHFQWEFFTELPKLKFQAGDSIVLHCEGLDYSGWIGIDGKPVAEFSGALVRHRFDLTPYLADSKPHRLSILFELPPEEQGQAGFTSRSHFFKPRYNFSWDWTPRLVPIGIWDDLWIETGPPQPRVLKVVPSLADDFHTGRLDLLIESPDDGIELAVSLARRGQSAIDKTVSLIAGRQTISLSELSVEPWFPNGYGKHPLYELTVRSADQIIDRRTVGFKNVQWLPNPGAPADAHALLCQVNGVPVFLQGVNWTPIRMDYHDTPPTEYKKRINLYKQMGCTILRVWGGAFLEREIFYDLCDRAGLMVWQEFPLSSSTAESATPRDPAVIEQLEAIATDYIHRRAHHASKLLWCGGNELESVPDESGKSAPLQASDPCLAALKQVVQIEDPYTLFLPTSPSGGVFYAHAKNFGKGIHSHVHGPWNHDGSWSHAIDYWSGDDSTFRSECGMPSAQSFTLMKKYAGKLPLWPPTKENPYWSHTTLFWLPKGRFDHVLQGLKGEVALKKFIAITEEWQTKVLILAASGCKSKFPHCSGFIIWMGHDCFPCPINTSILDFAGKPKPAYAALKKIFRRKPPIKQIVPEAPPL
jgi:beta-mannosidase